jgi:uncharacterized repeat protein (TIGR01451 family)
MKTLMIVLFSLMVCSSAVAALEDKPNLVLNLSVDKQIIVKDEEGKTKIEWQEVNATDPGDVLRYTIHYINKGSAEARNAVIVDPVPEGTSYIGNSAEGESSFITFSLDGKTFQSPPMLTYRVRQEDGTEKEYTATPEMYTHINWKLFKPVSPGGSGILNFRVKVK